jgi:broad specificity phosphatase PhoE
MNWSKKTVKFLGLACVTSLFFFVAGCSSDSSDSSPTDPGTTPAPESSGSTPDVGSSATGTDPTIPSANSSLYTFETTPGALAVAPDVDGFYDMGDVYKAVPKTSKIAFVIRHSKRGKSSKSESQLTPIGIQMAQTLGAKQVGDEAFYYASTDFVRTRETCNNIAIGRGETDVKVVTWDAINGGYFLKVPSSTLDSLVSKAGGNPRYISQYAFGDPFTNFADVLPSYFYDLYERGNQFVNDVVVANMPNWNRVSVLVTHDMLIEPLVVFVSNRTIDLRVYKDNFRWINYLSGVAVIVDEANKVTVLPVRGDEVGWMTFRDEVDEGV